MSTKKTNAPKVQKQDVEAAIKKTTYTVMPDGRTTICQLTLDNGFTLHEYSACVAIENFDEELGQRLSYERAFNRAWMFLGFRLADRLHQAKLRKSRGKRYRDAMSGMYVTPAYAKLNPSTTVQET